MPEKKRLDIIVVELGLLPTRQAAQAAIMDGGILVNGEKVTKPGTAVRADANIEVTKRWSAGSKYVSRGGLKLEKALAEFALDVKDRICLDIGASTGGFTDCLLKHGAGMVYAIDVGYGQLDWSLRSDARVVCRDRINARQMTAELIYASNTGQLATLAVADLSFISITKVLPSIISLLDEQSAVIALIKPQFEAGKEAVGKGGVVRDGKIHCRVLEFVTEEAAKLGLSLQNLTFSPIKGPAGNIEFLAYWTRTGQKRDINMQQTVAAAHLSLDQKNTMTN